MKKTVFVVDDNDTNLTMAKVVLKEHYRVMTLPSAAKMFTLLDNVRPDLILLDIEMPEMDGFEALKCLKENSAHSDIPVIFLTASNDISSETRGFQLGVVDFITKPFSAPVLLNCLKTHLNIGELVCERVSKIQCLQSGIVFVLADLLENRDKGKGGHLERTAAYIKIMIDAMIERGVYANELGKIDPDLFISSASLYDLGKIAVPELVLNKPEKLADEEFELVKTHAAEGERIIDQIVSRTEDTGFLRSAKLFAGYHHERWDGKGYPRGLKGTDIPLHGRIMALVDVYDALISERPCRKAFIAEEAGALIKQNAGTQFDPSIADIFYELRDQFNAVKKG